VIGCATYQTYDYDQDINFAKYKMFNWLLDSQDDDSKEPIKNTIIEKRFKRSIIATMKNKEISFHENPDFYVSYHVSIKDNEDISCSYDHLFHHGSGFYGGLYSRGFFSDTRCYSRHYNTALIMIDIIDAESNDLLWRGWASKNVIGPTISEQKVDDAVTEILKTFPKSSD
jgi:hypothetical protein